MSTKQQLAEAIASLNHDYRRQGRPYAIQTQAQGHVLTLRPRFRAVVHRLYGTTREARLSSSALDVLFNCGPRAAEILRQCAPKEHELLAA